MIRAFQRFILPHRAHRSTEPSRHSRALQSSPAFEYPPPPAGSPAKPPSREVPMPTSTLGKRQRSADPCDTTTILETDREDTTDKESCTGLHRPSRKRGKLEQSADDTSEAPLAGPSNTATQGQPENDTIRDGSPPETTPSRQPNALPTTAASGQRSSDRVVGDVIFTDQDFDFFDNPTNLHPAESHYPIRRARQLSVPFRTLNDRILLVLLQCPTGLSSRGRRKARPIALSVSCRKAGTHLVPQLLMDLRLILPLSSARPLTRLMT